MRTVEEIKNEISKQKEQMEIYIIRREQYSNQGNEFAYNLMNDGLVKVLAKIESLQWVLNESV